MAEVQRFSFGNVVLEWEYCSCNSDWDYRLRLFAADAFNPIPKLNSPDLIPARKKYAELILGYTKGKSFKWQYAYEDIDHYGTEVYITKICESEINLVTFMGQATALFNEQYSRIEGRNLVRRNTANTSQLRSFVDKDIIDRGIEGLDVEYPNFGYLQESLNGMILRYPFSFPASTKLLMISDNCYLIYYGKYAKVHVLPNESIRIEPMEYDSVKDELEFLEADIREKEVEKSKPKVKKSRVRVEKSTKTKAKPKVGTVKVKKTKT